MAISREQFDWEHRIKFLLKDSFNPKTFKNYKDTVFIRLKNAEDYVRITKSINPSIDTIKAIHSLAFGEVYNFGGRFREFNEEISIGRDGGRGAYYSQINEELELLSKQTTTLLDSAKSPEDKAKLISFYHIRYVKIHPFLDGNGRTGRVILDYQIESLLNQKRKIDFTHKEYIDGIQKAYKTNDLSKITKTLTGINLTKENSKTTYNLELKEIVISKDVGNDTKLKVPCGEDVELAQEIEVATMTERLKKAVREGSVVELGLKESTKTTKAVLDLDMASLRKRVRQEAHRMSK
jgi:fido (protein-threonine AMPylation protein)